MFREIGFPMGRALKGCADVSETIVAPKPEIDKNCWDAGIRQLPCESNPIRQLVVRVAADGGRRGHSLQSRAGLGYRHPPIRW